MMRSMPRSMAIVVWIATTMSGCKDGSGPELTNTEILTAEGGTLTFMNGAVTLIAPDTVPQLTPSP
jgi:hypothetical protein